MEGFFTRMLYVLLLSPFPTIAQNLQPLDSFVSEEGSFAVNPAAVHLPAKQWSATLIALSGNINYNTANIPASRISHLGGNFLRKDVLGTIAISTGSGYMRLLGPGFAVGLNSKATLSVSTSANIIANYWDVDGRLLSEIGEIEKVQQTYPYNLGSENMKMTSAVFSQLTTSISYSLIKVKYHSLKAGLSLHLINGTAHSAIQVDNLSGSIKRYNSYLTGLSNATGEVKTITAGNLYNNFTIGNLLKPEKLRIGASIGFIYEYSGTQDGNHRFKLGITIVDIGAVRYKADSSFSKLYDIDIPANKALFFNNNFDNSTFSQTTRVFDRYPEFFVRKGYSARNYVVGLPTRVLLQADYRFTNKFAANADFSISLRQKADVQALYAGHAFMLSPRWTSNSISLALPFSVQEYAGFNAGLNIRYKGLVIGSNSIIGNIGWNAQQLDFFAGISLSPGSRNR